MNQDSEVRKVAAYKLCRRQNYVHAAYVEAAVHINQMYGADRAYWLLIRERVPATVIARVIQGKKRRARRKDRSHATSIPNLPGTLRMPMPEDCRIDQLTSQRLEVALVFQSMLGTESAAAYLRNAGVPIWITARVLGSTKRRPSAALVVE